MEAGPCPDSAWFVYRSPYEGLSGKRVRRLPDATVLAWFQRLWTAAVVDIEDEGDAYDWVDGQLRSDLGGDVYVLASVFVQGHDAGIPASSTWRELGAVLGEHWTAGLGGPGRKGE
jgi:hypothetical protein